MILVILNGFAQNTGALFQSALNVRIQYRSGYIKKVKYLIQESIERGRVALITRYIMQRLYRITASNYREMTMDNEIKMPRDVAKIICDMEAVCDGEGIGPDSTKLMRWILKTYPDLKDEYSFFKWPALD